MRAAILARKSDDNAAGVERQVEIARKFIADKGWTVDPAHVYTDNDVSGAKFNRPGLNALLAAIDEQPRPFDVVVMMDSSRLGRDMAKVLPLQIRITRKVRVFFYQDGNELLVNTSTQKLTASVNNYGAENYREEIKKKTTSALREMAANGEVVGGASFGYKLVDSGQRRVKHGKQVVVKRREIDPVQAAAVVKVFELAAQNYGARKTAAQLRAERVVSPSGSPEGWTASGVKKILANELYSGVAVYGKTTWETRDDREEPYKVPVAPEQWIRTAVPNAQIVPSELYQKATACLEKTSKAYLRDRAGFLRSKPDGSKFLLSGFMVCECGANVIVIENGRSLQCSRRHRLGVEACAMKRLDREAVDQGVIKLLFDEVLTPENVALIAQQTALLKAAEPDTLDEERKAIAAEIARLETAKRRLLAELETDEDKDIREAFNARKRDLAEAHAQAEKLDGRAIGDRWSDPVYLAQLQTAIVERKAYLSSRPDGAAPLDVSALRSFLRPLLDKIVVQRDTDGVAVRFHCVLADSAWIESASPSANSRLTQRSSGERAG